ncbi:MAG: N-acetylmuramoyl-L-alanine amidase [Flavobacteriales bacterium]|nr:N-acetylmuramoyl-L-alanine amidase [Flavobacteriales bacterium]
MMDLYKRLLFLFLVCLVNINNYYGLPDPEKGQGIRKIVIDAGHGGHDPGCHGATEKEKHIALAISLKVGKLLEENLKDVEIIYTRKTDVFLELHERANIANKHEADLFVCIHANANVKSSAYGSETYVMGLHKSEENLAVAQRENSVILMEKDHKTIYQGFDPNSPEGYIALTLMQHTHLEQSAMVANKIQKNFQKAGRKNRGVKQAGFLVLHQTAMPSVLIETGFLTNGDEEKFLGSDKGQNIIAKAIFEALKKYKKEIESNLLGPKDNSPNLINDAIKDQVDFDPSKDTTAVKDNVAPKPEIKDSLDLKVENELPKENVDTSAKTVKIQEPEPKPKPKVDIAPPKEEKKEIVEEKKPIPKPNEIKFSVQFKTSPSQIPLEPENFMGIPGVQEYFADGFYKYIVGEGKSTDELLFLQNSVRKKGYKDAFIVAFQNGERIPIKKALDLLRN